MVEGKSRMMRTPEAAQYVGCAPATLNKWRCVGGGPRFAKLGPRIVAYRVEDLDAWLAAHGTKGNTADAPSAT
ncbi:MAG: helix-turn-helix transcriptional regulator [Gemmatimonadaceae bacterium]